MLRRWWEWEPAGLPPYETQRARLVSRSLLVLVFVALPFAPAQLFVLPGPKVVGWIPVAIALACVLGLRLMWSGRAHSAGRLLGGFVLALVVGLMVPLGGIGGTIPVLAVAATALLVLFLDGAEAVVAVAVTVAVIAVTALLGPLPPGVALYDATNVHTPRFLSQASALVLVALSVGSTLDAMRREAVRAERRTAEASRAAREADEANDAKAKFLATMSHELRTPLNAILGYAGLLREVPGPSDEELHRIEVAGARLRDLVDDLLEIARLDANVTAPALERVDLAAVVRAVAGDAVVPPDVTALVRTDAQRVTRILKNLLRQTSGPGDPPEVHLELVPAGWRVVVRFAHQAFPVEWERQAFEPFRASGRSKTDTGLGLALSRRLANQIRAELSVVVGEGTSYILLIPSVR